MCGVRCVCVHVRDYCGYSLCVWSRFQLHMCFPIYLPGCVFLRHHLSNLTYFFSVNRCVVLSTSVWRCVFLRCLCVFFLRLVGAFLMCAFSMCLPWLWLCLSLVSSSRVCALWLLLLEPLDLYYLAPCFGLLHI